MTEHRPEGAAAPFSGRKILLVEDEVVISFMVEDMLETLGCAVVWHASGVSEALAILAERRPDAAVLDVNLAGQPAYPIAERLAAAQIPFLFATGYGRHGMPAQWASRPTIQKPFGYHTLAAALGALLAR